MRLIDAWAKRDWAVKHFASLAAETQIGSSLSPHRHSVRADPDTGEQIIEIHLPRGVLTTWALMLGDVAHNLRSALDCATYTVARIGNSEQACRHVQFPISDSPPAKGNPRHRIACLASQSQMVIEALQPHNAQSAAGLTGLSTLRDLNDSDKHRSLRVIFLTPVAHSDIPEVTIGSTPTATHRGVYWSCIRCGARRSRSS